MDKKEKGRLFACTLQTFSSVRRRRLDGFFYAMPGAGVVGHLLIRFAS